MIRSASRRGACAVALLLVVALAASTRAGQNPTLLLSSKLQPFLSIATGREAQFAAKGVIMLRQGEQEQRIDVQLRRIDRQSIVLRLEHDQYAAHLFRDARQTVFVLPRHRVAFIGQGRLRQDDTLAPEGIIERLVTADTELFLPVRLITRTHPQLMGPVLQQLGDFSTDDQGITWTSRRIEGLGLRFVNERSLDITAPEGSAAIELCAAEEVPDELTVPEDYTTVSVDRGELERLLARGVSRAMEVAAPGQSLLAPERAGRRVDYGELRWVEDQRLVLLGGTPQQMGNAMGRLLGRELLKCRDSVLYMVGLGWTLETGRWFPDELRSAWQRLEPHIPADHLAEMDAAAEAAGASIEDMRLANIFPELFHCSGFAVMGSATADGKLYHGRVLDYMTRIGLQDAAAVFVYAPQEKIPFVTVGYAGFIGSVTGMNAQQISLGEMGGDGAGQWDGVPMATLMRRALEECESLQQVQSLWSSSPRTCEYYYVFADGKIPDAVGVFATPQQIEFVRTGQPHPLLGDGIADAVVLSAGSRLEALRARVIEQHGQIDADAAMALMCRPVAMSSNLHNALFVPQDLLIYVSHATHRQIAAEREYVKFDVAALIDEAQRLGPLPPEQTMRQRARSTWDRWWSER